jgi:microcompartment protein CcmK/EutM
MTLARVVAHVVAAEKHPHYKGHTIFVLQPVDPAGAAKGRNLLAVDGVQAGIGDLVLVVDEGGSARAVIGDESAMTIRTAICGIVDRVDIDECASGGAPGEASVNCSNQLSEGRTTG